jgi:hypothetical protein
MSELVANCPRCGAKNMTFDLLNQLPISIHYSWQHWLEVFCVCRKCLRSTVFIVSQKNIDDKKFIKEGLSNLNISANHVVKVERYVSIQDTASVQPPEHLPPAVEASFREGAACMAIGCFNAAGTMFRLCIDLATRSMLPEQADGLNRTVRRNLGLRLPWLFDNNILPEAIRELSTCIKDDGNDGAHQGTLSEEDATDILDFTYVVLERIYTEPARIRLANERRASRRNATQ